MTRIVRVLSVAAAVLLLAFGATPAQEWDDDVRLRIGGWFPVDLPTREGTLWGLEVRNLLNARNGIAYGVYFYAEKRTDYETLTFGSAPTVFTFHADVKIQPLLLSGFHIWPLRRGTCYAGAGAGLYPTEAFSGGFSRRAGLQISDFGDFRALSDTTLAGAHVYAGVDFFPDSRWGMMIEARFHAVEDSYTAGEFSLGGLFRF